MNEVIMGCVLQGGLGQNPARQAAIKAGLPYTVPAFTINKVCGSGLKSVVLAAQGVILGDSDIVIAGGMENMSMAKYFLSNARYGYKSGDGILIDSLMKDGLSCALENIHMGITAENLAEKFDISREEQDQYAALSQQKTEKAAKEKRFNEEIVPVVVKKKKGELFVFNTDEFPRNGVTVEGLSKLRPAFIEDGTVTAGNASGINDGAAAVIVMSEKKAKELGIKPLAIIRSYASVGVDPKIMGIAPVPATQKALNKAGMTIDEIDAIEANEAFAAQSVAVAKKLKWNIDKVNNNGGAISLGHPIGASGTRILVTLLYRMIRENAKTGLATLCIGGGQGIALIIDKT